MKLSALILDPCINVNAFSVREQATWYEGDSNTLYLQLVDLTQNRADQGFNPAGRRYMPVAGATLMVTINNLDDSKRVIRTASQPFAQDPSIWSVAILPTDPIRGTADVLLSLTEPGSPSKVTGARLAAVVEVQTQNPLV